MKRSAIADWLQAATHASRAAWSGRQARRGRRLAWIELGGVLAGDAVAPVPELQPGRDEVVRLEAEGAALQVVADASFARDRADYAAVTGWVRPVVVARGAADRVVIHSRQRVLRKQRSLACARLGSLAEESDALTGTAKELAARARTLHAAAEAADANRRRELERLGRSWIVFTALLAEIVVLGKAVLRQLRNRVPTVPSIAGMAVGWWFASSFTDSSFSATLHSLGVGSGPIHAVRAETYSAMQFGLPLAAAAFCSYAGTRVSDWFARRYAHGGSKRKLAS